MAEEIPEGVYRGRGRRGTRDVNANTGNEQVIIELELLDLNRTVLAFLYTSEKAMPWTIEKLLAMGWQEQDGADFRNVTKNEVSVGIKYETDRNGKRKQKVNILTGSRFDFSGPKGDAVERDFAARMKDAASKHRQGMAERGGPDPWDLAGKGPPPQPPAQQPTGAGPKLDL